MPDAIRAATDRPVGFVLDIDIELVNRWGAVSGRLKEIGISPPGSCPTTGFFGQLSNYPHRFGVWLMPDCVTDFLKIEHLCESLIASDNPIWPHAKASVTQAARLLDEANRQIDEPAKRWARFRDVDRIKSELHTWLSWQNNPGAPMGSAINTHALSHDSTQALAFLSWLNELYKFL
jgi:hypothetical protein